MNDKNTVCATPICEDNSKIIDEMQRFDAEKSAEEILANQTIIKIADELNNFKKSDKVSFLITLIISSLTLLIAIASLVVAIVK